ncbi:hypothetical protein ABZ590_39960, partial [Streptomyces hirsutus]
LDGGDQPGLRLHGQVGLETVLVVGTGLVDVPAGSRGTTSVTATGGVEGTAQGNLLTLEAGQGAQADLEGTLENGDPVTGLR